jgi:DNA adenine methylase
MNHSETLKEACSNRLARPFLKWAGGKRQLLPQLLHYVPENYGTYLEPFVGAGALFFALPPHKSEISDINPELINAYLQIQKAPDEILQFLATYHNEETFFYAIRSKDAAEMGKAERAARLIYLNRTCFNGLYRENKSGKFNVPFGRYVNPKFYDPDLIHAVSGFLQGVKIYEKDFSWVEDKAKPGDFVYFDPPYHPLSSTSSFTSYSKGNFSAEDQTRLRDTFIRLTQSNVHCLLSNSHCDFILDLYADKRYFTIETIMASRNINSKADGRGKIKEVIIHNRGLL